MTSPKGLCIKILGSGIGKPYRAVAREAAYDLVEDICPGQTKVVALSLWLRVIEDAASNSSAKFGSYH